MAKPTAKLPAAVEYVRVSTEDQAERDTPADQRAALDRLRATRPCVVVERIEEAVSGAKGASARPGLRRLLDLLAAGRAKEVRCRHQDRLTRGDLRERAAIFGVLADAGSVIVEASGRVIDPRDEMGELDFTLQGWFAARERRRIMERTLAGKRRQAGKGRLVQGRPPYGRTFDPETGTWGADPELVKVGRQVFKWCLQGRSESQIAAALNARGALAPRGGRWSDASVSRLLRQRSAAGEYTTHGHTFKIPALVDEATFAAAQVRLKSNNSLSGPRPKVFALLRKVATCGVCGRTIYLQRGGGTPSRFRYYYCSARDPKCFTPGSHRVAYHRQEEVEAKVAEALRRWLYDPSTLAQAARLDAPGEGRAQAERALAEGRAALAKLDKREENVMRLLSQGFREEAARAVQGEIRSARAAAAAEVSAAQAQLDAARQAASSAASLTDTVKQLRKGLVRATPERWREVCELLFRRGDVRLYPDGSVHLAGRLAPGSGLPNAPAPSGSW